MIKRFRKKFIMITALTLLSVILSVMAAINIINIYTNESNLDHLIDIITENNGTIPEYIDKSSDKHTGSKHHKLSHEDLEMFFTTRFSVVELDSDKNIEDINTEKIAAISEDTITDYTNFIITSDKTEGWIDSYKYRLIETDDGYMVILLDGSSAKKSNISIFLISITVGLTSFLLVLLIIILCSNRAIRPIAESYEKQKQFITNAGHELKTPLTIISANSEILKMTYGEDEWISGIEKQSEYLCDLVNSLVTLAKMDEGDVKTIYNKFSLSDAVYDTSMAFEGLCKSRNKKLHVDIDPNIAMNGDESSIRQVVSILLDNAFKYCDVNGDIYITLKNSKQITLDICNSYKDVKNMPLDRLFDRFYKADKSRNKKGSYGLGLSIAESIITTHSGKIKASNINDKLIQFEVKF